MIRPLTSGAFAVLDAPDVVTSGSMPVALLVAVAAGLVSFASPCVLPLVPGYLGYVTGSGDPGYVTGSGDPGYVTGSGDDGARLHRGRMTAGAALFVTGFAAVFVAVFATFSAVTELLITNRDLLLRVSGVVVVGLGLLFVGVLPGSSRRFTPSWRPAAGLAGAPLLGAVFGLGWSPCLSPTLATVLGLAASDGGGATRGVLLALAYAAGLGAPFVVAAAAWSQLAGTFAVLRRRRRAVQLAGGGLLVVLGVLMAAGVWETWTARLSTQLVTWTVPL
ncbi:MAG: cytochrome c biogenesis CcdA family protein [Angustibacter sp.]